MVKKEEENIDKTIKNNNTTNNDTKQKNTKTTNPKNTDEDKETLVELVYNSVKKHEHPPDVISGAFTANGLLQAYEEDYDNAIQGKDIPKRLTITEFNNLINDYLNK